MEYGLIGKPLTHSFSREIHGKIASYDYQLCEIEPEMLPAFMEKRDFSAINVTIPYKQAVIPFLSWIDENAKKIGAVNTVVNRDGKLYGYNTDFIGLCAEIRMAGLDFTGGKVLILGTGGTSLTAHAASEACGASAIIVVGRHAKDGVICYEDAYRLHADADFIINTTPCGMYPSPDGTPEISGIPIDLSRFPSLCGVIDVVFNPLRTNLILNARARGIPAEGGLYMLVGQAVAASELFTGTELPQDLTDRIYHELRAEKENIVLTGMPGSGKTTVGKRLAAEWHRPFYDTDAEIVRQAGKSIPALFEEIGEEGFRIIESKIIRNLANTVTGAVIATGGGAILRDDNIRALRRTGRLYFLNRPLERITPTSNRPLADSRAALGKRFAERYDRYRTTCDCEINTDENIDHTILTIRKDFLI